MGEIADRAKRDRRRALAVSIYESAYDLPPDESIETIDAVLQETGVMLRAEVERLEAAVMVWTDTANDLGRQVGHLTMESQEKSGLISDLTSHLTARNTTIERLTAELEGKNHTRLDQLEADFARQAEELKKLEARVALFQLRRQATG